MPDASFDPAFPSSPVPIIPKFVAQLPIYRLLEVYLLLEFHRLFDILYIYTIGIQITYKNMICITSTICYYLLLKSIIIHSYMKLHGVSKSMEVPLVIIHRWIFHLINHPFFGGYPHMWKPKKYVSKVAGKRVGHIPSCAFGTILISG